MMETESPQPAPPPSRYRTVRRKLATSNAQPTKPVEPVQVAEHHKPVVHKPVVHTPVQEQPLTRQPSKFRRILRLSIHHKEPIALPVAAQQPVVAPHNNKLHKSSNPAQRASAKREEVIELTLDKLVGRSSSRSLEKSLGYDEAEYDFKVPVHFDTGSSESMGVHNATDAETFLRQARPQKERILMESWHTLGLQRQIRHFELLSDVVNTWDSDNTQCQLRIEKICWGYTNLPLKDFPKEEPSSGLVQLLYFTKLEKKWTRRWIKLNNGSIRMAKKDKPLEKDFTQSIGLDSFDVYYFANPLFPHEKLKCPTKYCFALKSQHQQSLFGKDSVYCHYFAADNEAQMSEWYSLIRDFKSRLIAERRSIAWWTTESDSEEKAGSTKAASPTTSPGRGRHRQKPLISPEELAQPPPAMDMQRSKDISRERSIRHGKPVTRTGTIKNRSPSVRSPKSPESIGENESTVFFSGGLLGQDYEDKKRLAQLAYREERAQPHSEYSLPSQAAGYRDMSPRPHQPLVSMDAPPIENKGLQRRETVASRPSTGHKLGGRGQGGTLLTFDDTDGIPSLPHHRRGRGHTVSGQEAKSKGGLISFAKSHIGEVPPLPTSQMIGHMRPNTGKSRPHRGESGAEETGFTRTGLLSHGYHSTGAGMTGHGIANGWGTVGGNGDITPMFHPQRSVFAPGSLLEKREREAGPTGGPIIDRDPHSSDED